MTPGLGPDAGHTLSVCTPDHAVEASQKLQQVIERLRKGQRQTLVVGALTLDFGHGVSGGYAAIDSVAVALAS